MKKMIEFLIKGTLNAYEVFTYRTLNNESDFKFSYHQTSGGFEIDIHKMPNITNRETDAHTIHTLPSSRDTKRKICIAHHSVPQTLGKAQKISMEYAELIETYRKTGITPDQQLASRN